MTRRAIYLIALLLASPALALDDGHWSAANNAIDRGIDYLRATQNEDGSWSPKPGPAITALAVAVMLDHPAIDADDPAVSKAIDYILSFVHDDGSITGDILPNYNTAICLSALSRIDNRADIAAAVAGAQRYLRGLQWSDQTLDDGTVVSEEHPFYGGAGYGNHGRPDMSNTQMMLQALYDSGVDCNDPAFQRAMVFVSRCQAVEGNTFLEGKAEMDGGFIYATSVDKEHVGVPVSSASPEQADEAKAGRPVSGLRSYGAMTYAGFKSYLYANLNRDDPRVVAAFNWIKANYTLDRNPGMPASADQQGLYYYYMTMGRALDAWGATTVADHDWANDLIDAVTQRQHEDGSWSNTADRWMESDPNLVTAYALIALQSALR